MNTKKILIVGAGAIGGFYGALLAKAGADVSVVCRSDYNTVKQQGLLIDSTDLESWVFSPSQVVKKTADYQDKADYLILCTKIIPEINRTELIRDAITSNTTVVFIQNGIDIEQELLDAFPENNIISGLAFICCNRMKPGVIKHLAYGKLSLGYINQPHPSINTLQQLNNYFNQTGIPSEISNNIIASRWLKCLWNASFNPLSVITEGLSTQQILSSQEELIRAIMQEVCDIAKASGHPLPEDSIEINIINTHAMPPYKTSMLLDYERNKTMETEVILGNTIKVAKGAQVPCPILETLYALMKLKEIPHQNESKQLLF